MRKNVPVNVIVHHPKTETGKHELGKNVAVVHADLVIRHIQGMVCPPEQKETLLDHVIAYAAKEIREPPAAP